MERPNRSDIHLSTKEEAKIEEETREYFDGLAPKRHTKPQRSEYSTQYVDSLSIDNSNNNPIPEYVEFQRLEHDSQELTYNERKVAEEFVETEYYKDLNSIGNQHHTTGTGFIKMEEGRGFSLTPDSATDCHHSCKGNPATNDWIPSAADMATFASDKPKRSDI
ncbi:hypothetical protein CFOL_v3_17965 [Cephalotus follicularis]|uniref:Maternal effect embryo arrest 59 n=1 Tax=Cephalotus follicularis TaxID=3775 RepID=A0A1Q3C2P7_CEPFO|nr:hypothetical protein CFOL_v3_17965 [Cephalotus follicularis]